MGTSGSKRDSEPAEDSFNVHGIQYLPSKIKKSKRRQTKHNLSRVKIFASEGKDMCLMNGTPASWRSSHYPFENLVFSGGGSKGYAYIGALQALDDCGILPQIRRIAGSSVGAITASLVAVGCSPQELADIFMGDEYYVKWMFLDQKCVGCCGVPKIWKNYGVNNASRFYKILGEYYIKKVGKADITFQQLYDTYGMELCIPVTNLTKMCSEYCHWQTTPNMPIRIAVRMSMSLPVLYEPVKYNLDGKGECVYSDGGTLDQYPIHCFDGPEFELNHNTVSKEEQRVEANERTIGLYVISECTIDYKIWKELFDKDIPYKPTYFPQTKLSKTRFDEEYKSRKRRNPSYTRRQMSEDFKDPQSCEWLHYDTVSKEHVDINSFGKFVLTALETLLVSQRKVHVKPSDADRTVAINCGYTGTNDYELQPADREFLLRQGYAHTRAFLKDFLHKSCDNLTKGSESIDAPQITCPPRGEDTAESSAVANEIQGEEVSGKKGKSVQNKVEINGVVKHVNEKLVSEAASATGEATQVSLENVTVEDVKDASNKNLNRTESLEEDANVANVKSACEDSPKVGRTDGNKPDQTSTPPGPGIEPKQTHNDSLTDKDAKITTEETCQKMEPEGDIDTPLSVSHCEDAGGDGDATGGSRRSSLATDSGNINHDTNNNQGEDSPSDRGLPRQRTHSGKSFSSAASSSSSCKETDV